MSEQFSRTELLLGKEAIETLSKSRVAVFGVGGVGGFAAEALARSGVGALDLIDNDTVCLSNINRQIYATHSSVGRFKVDVAAERIADINPDAAVRTYKIFYTPETAGEFDFSEYDYIVDAIDTVAGKIALAVNADKVNTPLISSMGAGNKLDPTAFCVSDIYKTSVDPLAKVMRVELRKRKIQKLKVVYSKELPLIPRAGTELSEADKRTVRRSLPGSISFVPSVVGLIIAGEVIKGLTGVRGNGAGA